MSFQQLENNSEKVLFSSFTLEQLYFRWEDSTNYNCIYSHMLESLQAIRFFFIVDIFCFRDFFSSQYGSKVIRNIMKVILVHPLYCTSFYLH